MDVGAWLKELGLEEYGEAFAKNGVDASLLSELTNEDLKDLGILRLADRKRLLWAIAHLGGGDRPVAARPGLPSVSEGERRQVTVLFADIAGYTRLAGELGPEQTHTVLNRYFEVVDGIVESYGGRVDKHIGDCVMAVFGAPVAHDDDPMRAVRTALDIHDRLSILAGETGRPLQAHVGIANGQVVASGTGSDTHREYTVTGDSVNLACRLQDKAEPGHTLISDALHRAVADHVDCVLLGEVAVKGIKGPVPVWRVLSLRKPEESPARGAFVGRRAELMQFSGVVDSCRATGRGQAIFVRGEAGIGKTRLIEEFIAIAADRGFATHKGLVLDFGVTRGQDAIRSIVRSLAGVAPGSGETGRRERADAMIAQGLLSPEQPVFLNNLLDLPQSLEERATYDAMDNATRNEGKRTVVADLLRRVSAESPVVVVVEDVHWANPLMLTHLARIAATAAECPALLVMTSRIEGDPLDKAWRSTTGRCPLMVIDLGPLGREDALHLAGAYLDATNRLALECVRRADGNPLFLQQLLLNAEEHGGKEVPASIQSLVLARMDRLSPLDKQALQAASVLGQRFTLAALRHLMANPRYGCDALIDRHLVRPEEKDFLFAHALVQEGVYTSLLTTRRAELHRMAAAWYADQDLVLRAEHLDRADDPAAAAAYLEAAEAQATALHFETILKLTGRGIELADDATVKCELMCLRGDASRNIGATEDSIAGFEAALAVAADDVHRCRAWIGIAEGSRVADLPRAALEALDEAEAAAVRHGLVAERARIHYLRGNAYFPLGNIDGCLQQHEMALQFAREAGSTESAALALGGLGDAYYLRGHMRTACDRFRACIDVCREHGFGRIEVANRHMVGWSRIYLMEFEEALKDGLDSAEMAAEVKHHRAEHLGLMLAGRVELELGHLAEARAHLERGLDIARAMSFSNFEAQSLALLALLGAVEGRRGEARDLAQRALAIVREIGMTFFGPTALAIWAAVSDEPEDARAALAEAERLLDSGCVAHNHFWVGRTAIDYTLSIGDWDEAERHAARLEAYTREQPLAWPDFMIARGRALAAWGRGTRTQELVTEIGRLTEVARRKGLRLSATDLERAQTAAAVS
jgi:class 3 adenylate cyclase/tetratricopeptide (TPR) repeat protein